MKKLYTALLALGLAGCLALPALAEQPSLTAKEEAQIAEAEALLQELGISEQPDPGEAIERSLNAWLSEEEGIDYDGFYDPEGDRSCENWQAGLPGVATFGLYNGTQIAAPRQPDGMLWGVDVSHHQGGINWDVAQEGLDFAILRCGYGLNLPQQDDREWHRNAAACQRLGIPFGTYIYSYATDTKMARSEAEHVLRLVKGYKLDMPIYFDIEDPRLAKLDNATLAAIAKTFCDTVSAAGYKVGIYASLSWWNTRLTNSVFRTAGWERWVAHWAVDRDYSAGYDMWQYGGCYLKGVPNAVDGNVYYASRKPHKNGTETLADLLALARLVGSGARPTPAQLTRFDLNGDARLTRTDLGLLGSILLQ